MKEQFKRTTRAGKHLKPYQGLKLMYSLVYRLLYGRKTPKTLSGIETSLERIVTIASNAGKHLKPYQGLKHNLFGGVAF